MTHSSEKHDYWTLLRFGKIHVSRRHLPVRAGCFPDEGRVGTEVVQIPSAGLACEICGGGRISVVIGRALAPPAVLPLWRARRATSPWNCTSFWNGSPHEEKMVVPAHSQGGTYAWKFAKAYPEQVGRPVLLDPLLPEDCRFRTDLTKAWFKKSGADKTGRPKHCGRRSCGLMAPAPSAPSTAAIIST